MRVSNRFSKFCFFTFFLFPSSHENIKKKGEGEEKIKKGRSGPFCYKDAFFFWHHERERERDYGA
jgi:hypothetical protein